MIPIEYYLALGITLFGIGLFGVLTQKNIIKILMCMSEIPDKNQRAFSPLMSHTNQSFGVQPNGLRNLNINFKGGELQ